MKLEIFTPCYKLNSSSKQYGSSAVLLVVVESELVSDRDCTNLSPASSHGGSAEKDPSLCLPTAVRFLGGSGATEAIHMLSEAPILIHHTLVIQDSTRGRLILAEINEYLMVHFPIFHGAYMCWRNLVEEGLGGGGGCLAAGSMLAHT